jgi:nucleoside-triphosphatase THEP1
MIYIICGEFNSGKTAKIKSIYLKNKKGDGFITEKIYRDSIFYGYETVRLSTGEAVIQSLKSGFFPHLEIPLYTKGEYSFFREGFAFADMVIDDIILKGTCPVFIDEIGPLELQGKGFNELFKKIIHTDRTIYFTVRNYCLEKVISIYSLEKYSLIRV